MSYSRIVAKTKGGGRDEELEHVVTDGGAEARAVLNEVDLITQQLNTAQRHTTRL